MTANTCYQIIQYAINKNQDGYLTPDEFRLIINQAQNSFMDYLLGEFQQYQYGRPQARVSFGQNETVRQKLTPFIDSPVTLNINAQGLAPYPSNYAAPDAMYQNSIYMDRVRFVSQDRLFSFLNDPIDPVLTNPIYLIESIYLRFYPQNLGTAKFSYVKNPNEIVWGFTDSIYGQPVYDATTSTDPQWYEQDMLDIIVRALRIVGVNLQAETVAQYANEIKQGGQ